MYARYEGLAHVRTVPKADIGYEVEEGVEELLVFDASNDWTCRMSQEAFDRLVQIAQGPWRPVEDEIAKSNINNAQALIDNLLPLVEPDPGPPLRDEVAPMEQAIKAVIDGEQDDEMSPSSAPKASKKSGASSKA